MTLSRSLGELFGAVSAQNPDFPVIIAENFVLSYRQLWDLTQNFAANMQERGVDRTSLIAVNTQNMTISLATLLASTLLGARYVVANKILADSGVLSPTHFFRSEDVKGSDRADFITIDDSWSQGSAVPITATVQPNDPWLFLHTSGSTGTPKFFSLSQQIGYDRAIAAKVDFVSQKTRYRPLHKVNSRPFFVRGLSALLNTCTFVDSDNIAFWHRAGVTMVSGSPAQASGTFTGYKSPHKFPILEVSGAKVSDKQLKKFLKLFDIVEVTYGASETSKSFANLCSLDTDGEIAIKGSPQESMFEIVDVSGNPCVIGETGKVRIKNRYMIGGYLNAPDSQKELLIDGWYYPGDMARWGEHNELIILNRTDDIINLGGVKVDALLVDLILQSVEGISKAACFKNPKPNIPDELLAFVEFEPLTHREECIYRAKQTCQDVLGIYFTPQRIHAITEIPLNEKGTVNRVACQELLMDRIQRAVESTDTV
ncbi:MAG: acyl--CoA ligase [Rhodobacteraceae bacterium]|nr:acyl--CoA ligase [Paracoccaceae bacterium]